MTKVIKIFTALLLLSVHSFSYADDEAILQQALRFYQQNDYQQAVPLLQSLAEKGEPVAQGVLGMMYELGQGVEQDYRNAAKLFYASAKQGMAQSQFDLAMLYHRGLGVKQSDEKPKYCLKQPAMMDKVSNRRVKIIGY